MLSSIIVHIQIIAITAIIYMLAILLAHFQPPFYSGRRKRPDSSYYDIVMFDDIVSFAVKVQCRPTLFL